ncbi:MAG: putative DNA-binding domain-containing protein [Deltaproteobacteria bacterium]|nr:putative DNA-binding domain-containing protein [Deltaproteobacteria bacterium]
MRKETKSQPSLAELQSWLRWVIVDPMGVEDALEHREGEPRPRCLEAIAENGPLSRLERLDVYAEAYYARLLECLEQDFPALKRVLGDDIFRGLVAHYLDAHPSTSFTAAELGKELPGFIASWELAQSLPYLADLARFEWAHVAAFFAAEWPAFDLERFRALGESEWPGVKLSLDPSVHLIESDWNVDDVWEDDKQPAEEGRRYLVVYRAALRSRAEKVSELEFRVLQLLAEGCALGEVCEKIELALDVDAEMPPLMDWFRGWIESGVVRGFSVNG